MEYDCVTNTNIKSLSDCIFDWNKIGSIFWDDRSIEVNFINLAMNVYDPPAIGEFPRSLLHDLGSF